MNVVDSSGWLEYFAAGANVNFFSPAIQSVDDLLVPTISLYEVFKRVFQQRGEGDALQAVALMQQGALVSLTAPLALAAARISSDLRYTHGGQHHAGNRASPQRDVMESRLGLRGA